MASFHRPAYNPAPPSTQKILAVIEDNPSTVRIVTALDVETRSVLRLSVRVVGKCVGDLLARRLADCDLEHSERGATAD
jgi:hypothetical protein